MLSACANKLSRLKEQAEEYAALIMEELDPERLGYIEVVLFPSLFFIYFIPNCYIFHNISSCCLRIGFYYFFLFFKELYLHATCLEIIE